MLHPLTKLLLVTTVLGGLTSVAAAQGFDPMGDRRFQNLAGAGTAGFYLGEMQGPMSRAILSGEMDASEVMLNTAPVGLYAPGYAPPRRAISPAYPPGSMSPVR
jgi:hypothetical protein